MEDFSELNLIGQSPAYLAALDLIRKFAVCDATVLIQGETGTGKELAARAIHYLGSRRKGPFIPVNCGALPDSLVENELFGHVRGAFTDAREPMRGLVADAEGGTLFLDEIEALSPKAQVALLRFLQDGKYRPLGARGLIEGNTRVIAASNTDVPDLSRSGAFRQDLMYRLAILSIRMPALRERTGDPALLARHFIRCFAFRYGRPESSLDFGSLDLLATHDWPGNVRELENVIHRSFLIADDPVLRIDRCALNMAQPCWPARASAGVDIPFEVGFQRAKAVVVADFERSFVLRALTQSRGNVSAAARLIGKERRAMGRLLRKYALSRTAFD